MTIQRIYAAEPTATGTYTTRELPPTRVEIVRVEQPRPLSTIQYDDHIWEVAGQGDVIVGMPVNVARRSARRRERIEAALNFALTFACIGIVITALLWFTSVLVRVGWGG